MKRSGPRRQEAQDRLSAAHAARRSGRLDDAVVFYRQVLTLNPTEADAMEGLGLIAVTKGDETAARRWFEKALKVDPKRISTQVNLADVLLQLGLVVELAALSRRVVARAPDHPHAHFLLGEAMRLQADYEAAAECFAEASNLSYEIAGHIETLTFGRFDVVDWSGYEPQVALFENRVRAGNSLWQPILPMLFSDSPADIGLAAQSYAAMRHPPRTISWPAKSGRHDRIRIGYVTGEVSDHPVAQVFAGVLEHHDHEAFEIYAFSHGETTQDDIRRRMIPTFDHFLETAAYSDLAIAKMINDCEIDIAVTLGGYTRYARPDILAYRPAPVQVNAIGFPGTMGAPYIDYLLADRHVISPDEAGLYAEQIAWMPDTYQPSDDAAQIGIPLTREAEGLPREGFVFVAYNHPRKITPAMFDVWMRLLGRVPGSVLWLQDRGPDTCDNFRRNAAARGVDPDRLVFAGHKQRRPDHIARHKLADLFLDNLPYNAHSTASDALWAGLPVLTCRGKAFPGRVCAGLLTVAGMSDMVTETLADYEDLAVALAADPARLAAIRRRVETEVRISPLFDTARYTRNLEAAFRIMHETHQAGLPPRSFEVRA